MPRKKSTAVATEVIGLDGVKTIIEPEMKPKLTTKKKTKKSTSTKKTTSKKPLKQSEIEAAKLPESDKKDLDLKIRTKLEEPVETKVDTTDQKDNTNVLKKATAEDNEKYISDVDELVEQIADLLIKKLSKVFIRVEDAQQLVISTIQKLAIGELRADAPEGTE